MAFAHDIPLAAEVRCHAAYPEGPEPGVDIALPLSRRHPASVPLGCLLDDLLDEAARAALEREALSRMAAWQERVGPALLVEGVPLAWVWEVDLLADVFLPTVRTVVGLRDALAQRDVRCARLVELDSPLAGCLRDVLGTAGIRVQVEQVGAPVEYEPTAHHPRRGRLARTLASARGLIGAPPVVRGNLLVLPYWHLLGLHRLLLETPGLVPVHDPMLLPQLPPRRLVRSLLRGGWVGRPNGHQARRSRRSVEDALRRAERTGREAAADPLDALLAQRALALLRARAGATPAAVASTFRALARRRMRGVVTAWDSPPFAREVLVAAWKAEKPVLVVQHGFPGSRYNPDKTASDTAAVWSDAQARALEPAARGRVVVTGNPAAPSPADRRSRPSPAGVTMVLPEYRERLALRGGPRLTQETIRIALRALDRARPGTVAIIRPHPGDVEPGSHEALAVEAPRLRVEVDATSSIDALISRADLCVVAGVSTAALQAAVAGVPTVVLNATGAVLSPPFDGQGSLPVASSADDLAGLIASAVGRYGQAPAADVRAELGVVDDAMDRVVAAVDDLRMAPGPPWEWTMARVSA